MKTISGIDAVGIPQLTLDFVLNFKVPTPNFLKCQDSGSAIEIRLALALFN